MLLTGKSVIANSTVLERHSVGGKTGHGNNKVMWLLARVLHMEHDSVADRNGLGVKSHLPFRQPIRSRTKSGVPSCTQDGDLIELDFPATPVQAAEPPAELLDALAAQP